jgi:hypothetical protein
MRLGGSFLLASVFIMAEMAFINTFWPVAFCSERSFPVETFAKFCMHKMQHPAAMSFFIVKDYLLKIKNIASLCNSFPVNYLSGFVIYPVPSLSGLCVEIRGKFTPFYEANGIITSV